MHKRRLITNIVLSIPSVYTLLFFIYAIARANLQSMLPLSEQFPVEEPLWYGLAVALGVQVIYVNVCTCLSLIAALHKRDSLKRSLRSLAHFLEPSYLASMSILMFLGLVAFSFFFAMYNSTLPIPLVVASIGALAFALYYHSLKPESPRVQALAKATTLIITVISEIVSIAMIVLVVALYIDLQPDIYQDITFGDRDGKYIINYDGDYWLTYYTDRNHCGETSISHCIPEWTKKGNAPITQSPLTLTPFIDAEVLIDATPVAQRNLLGTKKFCIVTATAKNCQESSGPGTWHMSPLIIHSIQLKRSL